MMTRILLALFVALGVGLSGCAARNASDNTTLGEAAGQGLVAFSITHDSEGGRASKLIAYLDGGIANGGSMAPSLQDAIAGIPTASDFEDSLGRLYVLSLPAGHHAFTSWQITNRGARLFPKEAPAALDFDVVPGTARYLGNINARLIPGKNIFGTIVVADGYPEIGDRSERDLPQIEERYPNLKGGISTVLLRQGPWGAPGDSDRRIDVPPLIPPPRR